MQRINPLSKLIKDSDWQKYKEKMEIGEGIVSEEKMKKIGKYVL